MNKPVATSYLSIKPSRLIVPLTMFIINNPPPSFIHPPSQVVIKAENIGTIIIVHKARFDALSFKQNIRSHVNGICKGYHVVYLFQKSGLTAAEKNRIDGMSLLAYYDIS